MFYRWHCRAWGGGTGNEDPVFTSLNVSPTTLSVAVGVTSAPLTASPRDQDGRAQWMDETIDAVRAVRAEGLPVVGYTWFPMITMFDWLYRRGDKPLADYAIHLGLYDCAFDESGDLVRWKRPTVALAADEFGGKHHALRYTPNGAAVCKFRIAVNRRFQDANGQWKDGDTSYFTINAWRTMAENAAESLTRGTRVIVAGRLNYRTWENQDGDKRSAIEVEADEVAPSLKWATASVTRQARSGGASSSGDWGEKVAAPVGGGTEQEESPLDGG